MTKRANGEGSIYRQKNGLWAASITIGRDSQTGKLIRKYVYGKTKTEAQVKKAALLEEAKGGTTYIDGDKVTVKDWLEKWLATYAKPKVRQNTYESYESVARIHVIPHLGSQNLSKLQANQIQSMINDITSTKSARVGEYAFSVLRMSIRQAIREQLLKYDPTLAVSSPKKSKKELKPLSNEEWNSLFETAKKSNDMFLPLLVEWATGMRREEILGLRWHDIALDKKILSVTNVVIVTKDGPKFNEPKSKSGYRQIPVPEILINELKRHKAAQASIKLAAPIWQNHNLVFCREDGNLLDPRRFSHKFGDIAKAAGVKCSFHDLRHDHATRLFAQGKHPKDVQYRLGHSSISMTLDTYTHHVPTRQNDIADWLETTVPTMVTS